MPSWSPTRSPICSTFAPSGVGSSSLAGAGAGGGGAGMTTGGEGVSFQPMSPLHPDHTSGSIIPATSNMRKNRCELVIVVSPFQGSSLHVKPRHCQLAGHLYCVAKLRYKNHRFPVDIISRGVAVFSLLFELS